MNDHTWAVSLTEALRATGERVLAALPSVLGAAALLLVGWVVARVLRYFTERSLSRVGRLFGARRVEQEMKAAGVDTIATRAAGAIVFWIIFVLFVAAAGEFLGLAVITAGIDRLAAYLPTILGALLVLLVGIVIANVVRAAITKATARARLGYGDVLGQVGRGVVLLVTGVVALDQIGIDSQLLITATNILIASVVGGSALAFALGSRTAVANILALHYVSQTYRVGQRVRLGDLEGEIVEFKKTGVVVSAPEGLVLVPAQEFSERRSILVGGSAG